MTHPSGYYTCFPMEARSDAETSCTVGAPGKIDTPIADLETKERTDLTEIDKNPVLALTSWHSETMMERIDPTLASASCLARRWSMYYILVLATDCYPTSEDHWSAYTDWNLTP